VGVAFIMVEMVHLTLVAMKIMGLMVAKSSGLENDQFQ